MPEHNRIDVKKAIGKFAVDPLAELSIGCKLYSPVVSFKDTDATQVSRYVTNWGFFQGAIAPVLLKSEGEQDVMGTGFIVAPGLAITATHVFGDKLELLETGALRPYLLGLHDDKLDIWSVTDVSVTSDDDIALLSISLSSPATDGQSFWRMGLTTRTPRIGERLTIVGFRREHLLPNTDDSHGFVGNLYCAEGSVTAVYEQRRDPILANYPGMEIDCGSLHGMSGGVALDKNGFVVGVISRGFHCPDGRGPTYVSWIIKALGRNFCHRWPPGLVKEQTNMLSFDPRLLHIDRRDMVQLLSNSQLQVEVWH